MKAKQIIPVLAVGVLGAGAATLLGCEIQRLKNVIAAYKEAASAQEEVIAAQNEVIAEQERVIESYKKIEATAESKPGSKPSPPVKNSPNKTSQPKKRTQNNPEYIFQYDSGLNLVGKYESLTEACDAAKIRHSSSIGKVLRGTNLSAGGYFWSRGLRPLKKFPDKWVELSVNMKKKK